MGKTKSVFSLPILLLSIFLAANLHSEIDPILVAPNIEKNLRAAILATEAEFGNLDIGKTPIVLGAVILNIANKIGLGLGELISIGENWGLYFELLDSDSKPFGNLNKEKIISLISVLFKEENIIERNKKSIYYIFDENFCASLWEAGLTGPSAICTKLVEGDNIRIKVSSEDNINYEIEAQNPNGDNTYNNLSTTLIGPNLIGKRSNLTLIKQWLDKLLSKDISSEFYFSGEFESVFAFSTNSKEANCENGARSCLIVNILEPIGIKIAQKFSIKIDASEKKDPTFQWFFMKNNQMLYKLNIGALQIKPETMGELSLGRLSANIIGNTLVKGQSSEPSIIITNLSLEADKNYLRLNNNLYFALNINQGLVVDLINWWSGTETCSIRSSPLSLALDFFNEGSLIWGTTHERLSVEVKGQAEDKNALFILGSKAREVFENIRTSSLNSIFAFESIFSRLVAAKDSELGQIRAKAGALDLSFITGIRPKEEAEEIISRRKLSLEAGSSLLLMQEDY